MNLTTPSLLASCQVKPNPPLQLTAETRGG